MRVGIQILNYNGKRWLPGVLRSLERYGLADQRLYVVDNGSTDGSLDYLASAHPHVVVVALGTNLGYGGAYNRAIPLAFADGCDWVCLQNSDTLATPNWVAAMARAANDPTIGVMGPVFWKWDADEPNYYMHGRCRDMIPFMLDANHAPVDRGWIEGSSFFIRRECFASIGGFDPLYFMYWEDAEYCRRARLFGWRVVMVPGSVCRHYAGGSALQNGRSFSQIRNHLLYSLTDPTRSFRKNCLVTARLGATYMKQTIWTTPDRVQAGRVLKSIGSAVAHAPRCHRSRARLVAAWKRSLDTGGRRSPEHKQAS
jgi:GT2 family glycosyltransferase